MSTSPIWTRTHRTAWSAQPDNAGVAASNILADGWTTQSGNNFQISGGQLGGNSGPYGYYGSFLSRDGDTPRVSQRVVIRFVASAEQDGLNNILFVALRYAHTSSGYTSLNLSPAGHIWTNYGFTQQFITNQNVAFTAGHTYRFDCCVYPDPTTPGQSVILQITDDLTAGTRVSQRQHDHQRSQRTGAGSVAHFSYNQFFGVTDTEVYVDATEAGLSNGYDVANTLGIALSGDWTLAGGVSVRTRVRLCRRSDCARLATR